MYDLQTLGSKSILSTPSSMSGPESKLPSPMYNTPMSQDVPDSDDELEAANNVAASRDYDGDERKQLIIDADRETVGEKVVVTQLDEAEKVRFCIHVSLGVDVLQRGIRFVVQDIPFSRVFAYQKPETFIVGSVWPSFDFAV
jgi:hypothetical protein